jgi:hypothetical protein
MPKARDIIHTKSSAPKNLSRMAISDIIDAEVQNRYTPVIFVLILAFAVLKGIEA